MKLIHLSHRYGNSHLILNDLNLQIKAGDFVSILGPSGCGKSTLLRLIALLEQPQQGKIILESDGQITQEEPTRGFVFQDPRLLPWKSVLENVKLPLKLKKLDSQESHRKATSALEKVGLLDYAHHFPSQLSGGMKMRVSLARALVQDPAILLLDEPFASLDEPTRYRFQEDLRTLWESLKMTVLFVTHSIPEALYLSNRIVVLSKGPARILLDEPVAQLLEITDPSQSGSIDTKATSDRHALRYSVLYSQAVTRLSNLISTNEL